jgi:hypothetical protein
MPQKPHTLEYTKELSDGRVFHYTCNPPSMETLLQNHIQPIGDSLGCADPREVLLIPTELYKKHGYAVRDEDLKIVSEYLLRALGRIQK